MTTLRSAPPVSATSTTSMRLAMLGTRGVPAAYGGFETAVEEIGRRLVERGHEVTVYGRAAGDAPTEHLGMHLVNLPALHAKTLETLSHTAISSAHFTGARRQEVAFVFNAANAPFVPLIRSRGTAVAVHVDGLEWKRDKWGPWGRRYYRFAEEFAVREADALIADAQGIADYYDDEFGIPTELISYGSRILHDVPTTGLDALGLTSRGYHLVVARFEPENHIAEIVEGYHRSRATLPLVVVGSAPYAADYTRGISSVALFDQRIRLLGGVWDQDLLDQLYAHAASYVHGHSVGGTNPSLLRAMGAGTGVIAWDVVFNREVVGDAGRYFATPEQLANHIHAVEVDLAPFVAVGAALQRRAAERYDWDMVTTAYESLATRLRAGHTTRGLRTGHRSRPNRGEAALQRI